jgi:hypothetical protein
MNPLYRYKEPALRSTLLATYMHVLFAAILLPDTVKTALWRK